MNVEIFESMMYCVLVVSLLLFVIGHFTYLLWWDKTRIGKMEDENRKLKKMIVQKELENDLLKCKVDTLIDEQCRSTEAPADE